MAKQDGISWVEPWQTFRDRKRPEIAALYRTMLRMLPAFVILCGAALLFVGRVDSFQPALRIDYRLVTLVLCGLPVAFGIAPLAEFCGPRDIRVGPDALRIGASSVPYKWFESIKVDAAGDRPLLVAHSRAGLKTYGIAGSVDLAQLDAYLTEHVLPKCKVQLPWRPRDLWLNWLALFLGVCAGVGLLGLVAVPACARQALGREMVGAIASAGFIASIFGGAAGLWTLFRTRSLLVILASLAAIAALMLTWFYVVEPMLKP